MFVIGRGRYAKAVYPQAPRAAPSDHKVSVTVADPTPDYLAAKVAAGAGIVLTVLPGQQLEIAATAAVGPPHQTDEFVAGAGQTVFVLSAAPTDPPNTELHVNGVLYNRTSSYTTAGAILTWLDAPFVMSGGDNVVVAYQK